MIVTDDWITGIMRRAKFQYSRPVRVQLTAGWGCIVLEIYERDVQGPQIPLMREIIA